MTLFIRFYLILVLGLILLAAGFDYAFNLYQTYQHENNVNQDKTSLSTWSDISQQVQLIELAMTKGIELKAIQSTLNEKVSLLPLNTISVDNFDASNLLITATEQQKSLYFYRSTELNKILQIGPVDNALETTEEESFLVTWLPSLFYLSIILLAAWWFRPLLSEVSLLNKAARQFAHNYHSDLSTLDKVKSLKPVAKSFVAMSEKIKQLIQNQKDLTNALSHEMRTPLARMKFSLAMMPNNQDKNSINEDINELEGLIKSMLEYARLEHRFDQDSQQIKQESIQIPDFLQGITKRSMMADKELIWRLEETNQLAKVDQYTMGLALSNLIVNACRYGSQCVLISYAYDQNQGNHVIKIEDDGSGIALENRDKVFQAFTRLEGSRNKDTGGFGLGLAITQRIIQMHGGSITIGDSPLGGAVFEVIF